MAILLTRPWLDPTDHEWAEALARLPHDVYDVPAYLEVSARHAGGVPVAYHSASEGVELLVPLLLSQVPSHLSAPQDILDAASPYGYPSALMTPGADPDVARRLLERFVTDASGRGIVSIFLRFHPLSPVPLDLWSRIGTVVEEGVTVYIDLLEDETQTWQATTRAHRRGIEELLASGYKARMDDWSSYPTFIAAYRSTMSRVQAPDAYRFSDAYFADVRASLGPYVHLCTVIAPDGEVAAGGLFFVANGIVQHHLAATAEAYRMDAPSKLVVHHGRIWAKRAGHRVFHLGGGVGACDDSLLQFKKGFSKARAKYATCRIVVDQNWYEALTHKAPSPTPAYAKFFPPYRIVSPMPIASARETPS